MEFFLWLWFYGGIATTLAAILRVCWTLHARSKAARRAPAPELSERWKCQHANLIDVESVGEIVAYICADCDDQIDVDSTAATRHRVRNRVDAGYRDMVQELGEEKAKLLATIDEKGRQTDAQARRFAARTQQLSQGGYIASDVYLQVEPDLEGFRTQLLREGETRPAPPLRVKRVPR